VRVFEHEVLKIETQKKKGVLLHIGSERLEQNNSLHVC